MNDASTRAETDPLTIDVPAAGRTYAHRRRVHLADGSPQGRARLDALARMLQDVSDEDTTDAGFPPAEPWVVRRVDMGVAAFPTFRDTVTVTTWCSGIGGRWAERRVRIVGDGGGRVDAAVLWVHLDERGRPARLPERFAACYAEAAAGRTVRARLHHDARPDDVEGRPFPLRFCDFDVMDHVNNAISWVPVEQALAERRALRAPIRVSVEHPAPIEMDADPEVVVRDVVDDDPAAGFDLWISVDGQTCSTARARPWLAGSAAARGQDSAGSGTSA